MDNYPSWAAQVIWYEIFPERFCRKNYENPISSLDILGTTPWNFSKDSAWEIHPWTSDWYRRQPYEKENSKSLKINILRRRYCGDLKGIISKLDYLSELGVNALYFTPMQYSPSLHRYDGTNFLHIDPFLGDNALEDLKIISQEDFLDFDNAAWTSADLLALEMIKKAHSLGMKVVFDGVFNHIGYNSKPFQDVMKNAQKSEFADWFLIDWEKSTKKNLVYQKFWGFVKEMPKLNYGCKKVKEYVFSTLKRWLKPIVSGAEFEGIDGWRIDHAIGVPLTFWKSANAFVKTLKPDALFLGELIEPLEVIKPYLDEKCFDSVMNYGFYFSLLQFFVAQNNSISALQFDKLLRSQLKLLNLSSNFLAMNLLGTHDTERFASYIVNRDLKKYSSFAEFFENSHIEDKKYNSRCPNDFERKIQKMAVVFEFSMVGSPMIYYGDELGMWGANDPDCRKPMIWPELSFEDEQILVGGRRTKKYDKIEVNQNIFDFYKRIINFRKSNIEVLSWGKFSTLYADKEKRVYIYERTLKKERIIFGFNCELEPCSIEISLGVKTVLKNVLNGTKLDTDNFGHVRLTLEPVSFTILSQCE